MTTVKPHSLRGLLVRSAATAAALLVLYVLSVGPVSYWRIRQFHFNPARTGLPVETFFEMPIHGPVWKAVKGTPLERPLKDWRDWWVGKAMQKYIWPTLSDD
jgi:hypothetical protein